MKRLSAIFFAVAIAFSGQADEAVGAGQIEMAASPVAQELPVWMPKGRAEIKYNVLRKGKPFGEHNLFFEPDGENGFTVTNDIELTAKIGPITVYSYRHNSTETWQDSQLVGLKAQTRKEGNDLEASANLTQNGLSVMGTNYTGVYPADIVPASHWNVGQLYSTKMLSTEGGQALDVVVQNLGRETITVAGKSLKTTKYKLSSELDVNLWYDDAGRWVKLDFVARGQTIEYVLQALYE